MGSQGISREGETVRLIESQIWHWPASSVGGGVSKGTIASAPFLSERKLSPSSYFDTRYSVAPCMPLVPFKLPFQCWSLEGMSQSKSVCGFFKRNCVGLQEVLPLTQSPLVFAARSFGDLSSRHWNPGLGGLVWGLDFSLPRYPSWIFIYHMWMWDQPIPLFLSLLPVWMDVVSLTPQLLDFHSTQFLMVLNDGFFYILAVILMWLCEEVSCVYLCHHLDWKSAFLFY